MSWKGPCPLLLGLKLGLHLHGDHMLGPAQGMAEEKVLDPAVGCISVIQDSLERGAWNVAPRWWPALGIQARSLQKEQVSTQQGRACFQWQHQGGYEALAGEKSSPPVLSLFPYLQQGGAH